MRLPSLFHMPNPGDPSAPTPSAARILPFVSLKLSSVVPSERSCSPARLLSWLSVSPEIHYDRAVVEDFVSSLPEALRTDVSLGREFLRETLQYVRVTDGG